MDEEENFVLKEKTYFVKSVKNNYSINGRRRRNFCS